MTGQGWIPLYRKLFDPDHPFAPTKADPASRIHAWLDLCQLAQHDEYEHAGERLKRGEFLAAMRWLGARWGWSAAKVYRFTVNLKCSKTGTMIETVRETRRGTVYRIVNYERYAVLGNAPRNADRNADRNGGETQAKRKRNKNNNEPQRSKTLKDAEKPASPVVENQDPPAPLEWGDFAHWFRTEGAFMLWDGENPPDWANANGRAWDYERGLSVCSQLWKKKKQSLEDIRDTITHWSDHKRGACAMLHFNEGGRWDRWYRAKGEMLRAREDAGNKVGAVLRELAR
jgi:hypothetical protein